MNDLTRRRFHIFERNLRLFGSALGLKSVALRLQVVLGASREGLSHVGVALVFLVDQMVRCRDVVMTIGFEASYRVVLFKLEIVDQSLKKIPRVRHLLESREHARFLRLGGCLFLSLMHVRVATDI